MDFTRSERGVSEVVGAILVFAILIIALSSYQAVVVPQENRQVEYNSYLETQGDMTRLLDSLGTAGTRGIETGLTVRTGTTYPERTFAINPPPSVGSLGTGAQRTITIENASAIDAEARNTRRRWNGTTRTVSTRDVVFDPNYAEFGGQPIVTTPTTTFVVGETSLAPLSSQSLLRGDTIRPLSVDGTLSSQGTESSVSVVPRSTATRSVVVAGQDGPLTLRMEPPARTGAAEWVDAYGAAIRDANTSVRAEADTVLIQVAQGVSRELQLAAVTVGSGDIASPAQRPTYITAHSGGENVVASGKRTTLVAEVRDAFDNAVPGTAVTFELLSGDARFVNETGVPIGTTTTTVQTNAQGRAPQVLQVEGIEDDVVVQASFDGGPGTIPSTNFTVETPSETNPVQLAGVAFNGATRSGNTINVAFENQIDEDRNITKFRMNFYQGGTPQSGTFEGQAFTVGGGATVLDPPVTVPANTAETFSINFDSYNPSSGEWFIITVQYDTGDTGQYFGSV